MTGTGRRCQMRGQGFACPNKSRLLKPEDSSECVFISCGNKVRQTGWLKIIGTYFFTALESDLKMSESPVPSEGLGRSLPRLLWLLVFLAIPGISWLWRHHSSLYLHHGMALSLHVFLSLSFHVLSSDPSPIVLGLTLLQDKLGCITG